MTNITTGRIETNDGVTLEYQEAGAGDVIVLVHGWEQSGSLFSAQLESLSSKHRVVTYDQRGHGASGKPEHGYKVHRLAADLADLLRTLDLTDITLLGHSMGTQVVLAYLELFGEDRIKKVVLVDEPIFMVIDPSWGDDLKLQTGALFDQEAVLGAVNGLAGADTNEATVRGFIDVLTSPGIDPDLKERIVQENLRMNGRHSAQLFYNHAHQDWRTQLPRITVPTLIIGGEASIVPEASLEYAASQVPNGRFELFGADEGGSHFMFVENPEKFNAILDEFVSA